MINLPGELSIRTIQGSRGAFNVGRLATSIGEFVIKEALLDQYDEGKYRGHFVIAQIKPSTYSTSGRLVVEIRAWLEGMSLENVDELTDADTARLVQQEVDPLEEETRLSSSSSIKKIADKDTVPNSSLSDIQAQSEPDPSTDDAQLFETLWPLSDVVRLDSTVTRQVLRQQIERLAELGYKLDYKTQEWALPFP